MAPSEQSKLEESGGSGYGFPSDIYKEPSQANFVMNDVVLHTKDDAKSHTRYLVVINSLGKLDSDKKPPSNPLKDQWKPVGGMSGQNYDAVPIINSNMMVRNVSQGADQEQDYTSISTERQPSPNSKAYNYRRMGLRSGRREKFLMSRTGLINSIRKLKAFRKIFLRKPKV